MTRRTPILVLAFATAFGAFAAGARAAIDNVESVHVQLEQSPEPIVVKNDGSHYTFAVTSQLHYHAKGSARCKGNKKLYYCLGTAGLGELSTTGGSLGPTPYYWREVALDPGFTLAVPVANLFPAVLTQNPVASCNAELERRVAAGELRTKVLQSTFNLFYRHEVGLAVKCEDKKEPVESLGGSWPEGSRGWKIDTDQVLGTILCQGNSTLVANPDPPGPGHLPGGFAQAFGVTEVTLHAQPERQKVVCPAKVHLRGTLTANGPGEAEYRLVENGAPGPVARMRFPAAGRQVFDLDVDVPAPGGGGPRITGGGGGGGIGGFATPSEPGEVRGWARVDLAAGGKRSNEARWSVVCKPAGQPGPGGILGGLPDLVIQDVTVNGPAKRWILFKVKNVGVGPTVLTHVTATPHPLAGGALPALSMAVGPLAAGASTQGRFFLPVSMDQLKKVSLRVDDPNVVNEQNEDNNHYVVQ